MAFLMMLSGEQNGKRIEFDRDEITMGRAPDNVILLDDGATSGHHCVVRREGSKYFIKDLNSTNGTRLNGRTVTESRLSPKDVIMVGGAMIMIGGEDVEPDPSAPPPVSSQVPPTVVMSSRFVSQNGIPTTVFKKRSNTKGLWIALTALVGVLALIGLTLFVINLSKAS